MRERADHLVRIDVTGAAHPVGRVASRELRQRQGSFRMMTAPADAVVMRRVHEDEKAAPGQADLFWLAGEITRHGALWDIVGLIGQGNWTGELVVQDDDSRRELFFERGSVIGAYSTAERERLGQVLYRYGALTEEQVQQVAAAVTPALRFGEAAVRLGLLTNERLFQYISRQTEEVVYAVMIVARGEFYFREGIDPSRLSYRLNLSVTSLMMEGAQRMDEMECFRARIPSALHVPARVAGATVADDNENRPVWDVVDGARSVEEIARALGRGEFETTRALFQLLQGGAIAVHPPRPTGPEAIVTLFNQVMSTIMAEVAKTGGETELREQLSSFATASGVYDALFGGAGPAQDGTLDPGRIAESAVVLIGPDGAAEMLAQWLYEYAAFAMFVAEPLLRAASESEASRVSKQVAELLGPLAPDG